MLAAAEEGSQVCLEDLVPLMKRKVGQEANFRNTGIVDQDINPAKFVVDCLKGFFDKGFFAGIPE